MVRIMMASHYEGVGATALTLIALACLPLLHTIRFSILSGCWKGRVWHDSVTAVKKHDTTRHDKYCGWPMPSREQQTQQRHKTSDGRSAISRQDRSKPKPKQNTKNKSRTSSSSSRLALKSKSWIPSPKISMASYTWS